jgi:hypothetical protein
MRQLVFGEPSWPRARLPASRRLRLANGIVEATIDLLRDAARDAGEGIVLWAGRPDGSGLIPITHVIQPDAVAAHNWLRLDPAARLEVVQYLRAQDVVAVADVHSHPFEAFLSPIDRAAPYSSKSGHIAIVVPDLARGDGVAGWRLFEFDGTTWVECSWGDIVDD